MRILIIRGGAIGDLVLTLPAIDLLRKRWPEAQIECLGYPGIARLGLERYYFDAVRPMDYGPLAGFFIPDLILDPGLMEYFGSFNLILNYVFDPDEIFRKNLLRCGLRELALKPGRDPSEWAGSPPLLLSTDPRIGTLPAIQHFARPLKALGLENPTPSRLYLSEEDRAFALARTGDRRGKIVAMHPGSGGISKNWPIDRWIELAERIQKTEGLCLLVTGGEADAEVLQRMRKAFPMIWLEDALDLNQLAALYSTAGLFLGHDSGPGHLAAAVGAPSVLLFGPTDPAIWAPAGEEVLVLRAAGGLDSLTVEEVWKSAARKLGLT